ncbi:MAG: GspE/PulE/PilB domain-containing protein, partial [Terriglobales bacterium]
MATENKPIFVGGGNGAAVGTPAEEEERARDLARRYRCEFLDLRNHHIQHELMRKVPVELMFRFNFVPLEELPDGSLAIAM